MHGYCIADIASKMNIKKTISLLQFKTVIIAVNNLKPTHYFYLVIKHQKEGDHLLIQLFHHLPRRKGCFLLDLLMMLGMTK